MYSCTVYNIIGTIVCHHSWSSERLPETKYAARVIFSKVCLLFLEIDLEEEMAWKASVCLHASHCTMQRRQRPIGIPHIPGSPNKNSASAGLQPIWGTRLQLRSFLPAVCSEMWNNQLGSCVLGRYLPGWQQIQLEEEKVEKVEEVEDGDDVRRSPWLNLVIRASGGVGMVGGILVDWDFCSFTLFVGCRALTFSPSL